jgi:hypothetical protein
MAHRPRSYSGGLNIAEELFQLRAEENEKNLIEEEPVHAIAVGEELQPS